MTHRIFISYASGDLVYGPDRERLDRFYEDLVNEIAVVSAVPVPRDEIAFLASADIQAGRDWTDELAHALRTSHLMLSLYSPQYFASVWCGREFKVFINRRERWLQGQPVAAAELAPTAVIPVIWVPRANLPECVSSVQFADDDFPEDYRKLGLRKLLDLHRVTEYKEVLTALAARVIAALQGQLMPSAPALGPMHQIHSAFHAQPANHSAPTAPAKRNRSAYFVFAAAEQAALQGIKKQLGAWGLQDGWDWRPYYPPSDQSVGAIAQLAAGKKNLRFQELLCDETLAQQLKDVRKLNAPVVIFADPWTATLPAYRQVLEEYDDLNLTNCALLVPWNEADPETAGARERLEQNLRAACNQKIRFRYPSHYWQIRSSDEFGERALGILDEITLRLVDQAGEGELRRAESVELVNAAAAQGISTDSQPQLSNVDPPSSNPS